jgi:hypothetical protein
MVTIPGILSPVTTSLPVSVEDSFRSDQVRRPRLERILADETMRRRLEAGIRQSVELTQPLTSVGTRRELDRELGRRTQDYLRTKNENWHVVLEAVGPDVGVFASEAFSELERTVRQDRTILGADERRLLLRAIAGLRDLLQAAMELPEVQQSMVTDILLECSAALQRVDMCMAAVMFVLVGEIDLWNPISIRLLTHAASDYMLEVEDILLVHDHELAHRLRTRGEVVSFDEIRRGFELPD